MLNGAKFEHNMQESRALLQSMMGNFNRHKPIKLPPIPWLSGHDHLVYKKYIIIFMAMGVKMSLTISQEKQ